MRRAWNTLCDWARRLKREIGALWLAARDPRVPSLAKVAAATVVAFALSPIDLIPDFIPVLGYVDDLALVPLGILLAVRLVPAALMAEFRAAAISSPPTSRMAAVAVVALWCGGAALCAWLWLR